MRPCFVFNAAPADKPGNLSIYDEIGFWGTQAKDFHAGLAAISAQDVHVEISSPGGDYFAGLAMYNMLRSSGKTITTKVMGVAASAATVVFAAGDVREMPKNTMLMVHSASNFQGGTAQQHREIAESLDKIGLGLHSVYARNSSMTDEQVAEMLGKDTWILADEAFAMGLATVVTDEIKATASFDMTRADLPASVRAIYQAKTPEEIQAEADAEAAILADVEAARIAAEADALNAVANPAVATAIHGLAVTAGLTDYAAFFAISCETVVAAQARMKSAGEIVALCSYAKKPEVAGPAIRANKSIADVRAAIVAEMAEADIHTSTVKALDAKTTTVAATPATTASIWDAHRAQSKSK